MLTRFTREEIAAACRLWGKSLWVKGLDIDGPQLLWALAGKESSFGANCTPRHEDGYCPDAHGRYSSAPIVQTLTAKFGHAAHCSYGPWQILLVNCGQDADPQRFERCEYAAMKTVAHINTAILDKGATTIEQIADAYNSGNFRDGNVPEKYIADVLANYKIPMPEAV